MSTVRAHPAAVLALIAVLLLATYSVWLPSARETIRVTPEMIEAIVEARASLLGTPLDEEERRLAIEQYIEDEVLVREAFHEGLDRSDRRVRDFLISAAQSVLLGSDSPEPVPTPDEVADYYAANRDNYTQPATLSVEHLSFLPGSLPEDGESILAALRAGENPETLAGGLGRPGRAQKLTRSALSVSLGRVLADDVLALPIGEWGGPFRSSQGSVYIRFLERRKSRPRSFEEVRDRVERDWIASQYRAELQETLAEIRDRYDVQVEDGDTR